MKYSLSLSTALIGATATLFIFHPAVAVDHLHEAIPEIARSVTVQITGADTGSGVIIKHEGNTYTVLSAKHVVENSGAYAVNTPDGQNHSIDNGAIKKFPEGVDLAILFFQSTQNYQAITLGDSTEALPGKPCYVSGFAAVPGKTETRYQFSEGEIAAHSSHALAEGYALAYLNDTFAGMSGGPVLNDKGELIGIHGQALSAYTETKGLDPNTGVKFALNLAIPLNRFLQLVTQVEPNLGFKKSKVEKVNAQLTADDLLVQSFGKSNADRADLREILTDINRAIKLSPRNSFAYYFRGLLRSQLQDKKGAITDYDRAIQINPNFFEAYNDRGATHADLGDDQSAIADYNRAIAINPYSYKVYYNRGISHKDLGDSKYAIFDYSQAIQLNPDFAIAYTNRGIVYGLLSNNQSAISDYDQALRLNPDDAETYYNRGIAQFNLGDKQSAIADYDQAIQLRPTFAMAYGNRGIARSDLGDKQGGITDLRKAAELFKAQGKLKDYQKALGILEKWERENT
jgi:tetratricopeptide (TPR) repeat protein